MLRFRGTLDMTPEPPVGSLDEEGALVFRCALRRRRSHRARSIAIRQTPWLRFGVVVILASTALVSAACALKTINQVLADPSHYRDRQVQLAGAVVDSYSLANRGAYRIDDDTGPTWVGAARGTAP